jgi:hypothetical protein
VIGCLRPGPRLRVGWNKRHYPTPAHIHLPLQGLDYWSRVEWHHARGEFKEFGYFSGRELSGERPLLLLVTPTLHIHPATDTVLRYIPPEVDWTLVGIDERWRDGVRVIFRKRSNTKDLTLKHRDAEKLIEEYTS